MRGGEYMIPAINGSTDQPWDPEANARGGLGNDGVAGYQRTDAGIGRCSRPAELSIGRGL